MSKQQTAKKSPLIPIVLVAYALLIGATVILYVLTCRPGAQQASAETQQENAAATIAAEAPATKALVFTPNVAPQVRVYDNELQWYNGVHWHTVGSCDELRAADPAIIAENESTLTYEALAAGIQQEAAPTPAENHNRATGTVPVVVSSGGGGGGGGGSSGGGGGGGSSGGGGGSSSGDGEDINPFG